MHLHQYSLVETLRFYALLKSINCDDMNDIFFFAKAYKYLKAYIFLLIVFKSFFLYDHLILILNFTTLKSCKKFKPLCYKANQHKS